jgi:phage antirepressor YoqD-like protein
MAGTMLFEKTMTTAEVAGALGCSVPTVFYHANIYLPNKKIESGRMTFWTEAEVTVILEGMKRANNNQHDSVKSLQSVETLKILELEKVIDKLRKENAVQAERLAIAEAKAEVLDEITASRKDVSVRELAAILAIPHLGQNNLFQRLYEDGYIDGLNRPYRQYIERGLLYEKEYYVSQTDETKRQLRITQKGVAYFTNKYTPKHAESGGAA